MTVQRKVYRVTPRGGQEELNRILSQIAEGAAETEQTEEGKLGVHGDYVGTVFAYDDFVVNPGALQTVGAGVPTKASINSSAQYGWQFTNEGALNNEKRMEATLQMTHRRKPNSNIFPHLHIVTNGAVTGGDKVVRFELSYVWTNDNASVGANTTITVNKTIPNGTPAYHTTRVDFGEIDGTDKGLSSMLGVVIRRKSSEAADTYEDTVFLIGYDAHIVIDRAGSETLGAY